MVKTINPTGGITWINEDRLEEYLARGHKLTPPPPPPPPKKKSTKKQGG